MIRIYFNTSFFFLYRANKLIIYTQTLCHANDRNCAVSIIKKKPYRDKHGNILPKDASILIKCKMYFLINVYCPLWCLWWVCVIIELKDDSAYLIEIYFSALMSTTITLKDIYTCAWETMKWCTFVMYCLIQKIYI